MYDSNSIGFGRYVDRSALRFVFCARLGYNDKSECIKRLHKTALEIEKKCDPQVDFEKALEHERNNSALWGGRTVMDD